MNDNIEAIARNAAHETVGDVRSDAPVIARAIRRALHRDQLDCERISAEFDFLLERARGLVGGAVFLTAAQRVRLSNLFQRDDIVHRPISGIAGPPDKDGGPMWHNMIRALEGGR